MSLSFFAADTLDMTLYAVKDQLLSTEFRKLGFGPWRFEAKFEAVSDLVTAKELTFWLTVNGQLPLYLVVKEKECWLMVCDPAVLKPLRKQAKGQSLREAIATLKPAVKKVFHWKDGMWLTVTFAEGQFSISR